MQRYQDSPNEGILVEDFWFLVDHGLSMDKVRKTENENISILHCF